MFRNCLIQPPAPAAQKPGTEFRVIGGAEQCRAAARARRYRSQTFAGCRGAILKGSEKPFDPQYARGGVGHIAPSLRRQPVTTLRGQFGAIVENTQRVAAVTLDQLGGSEFS